MLSTILFFIGAFVIGMDLECLREADSNIKARYISMGCSFVIAIICLVFSLIALKNNEASIKEWLCIMLIFLASGFLKVSTLNNHRKK